MSELFFFGITLDCLFEAVDCIKNDNRGRPAIQLEAVIGKTGGGIMPAEHAETDDRQN